MLGGGVFFETPSPIPNRHICMYLVVSSYFDKDIKRIKINNLINC